MSTRTLGTLLRKAASVVTTGAVTLTGVAAFSVAATIPSTLPTHAAGLGGPVQLDGMDPVCHSTGESTGQYIAAVLKSLHDQATISGSDGSIAILGTNVMNACGASFDSSGPNDVETQYLAGFGASKPSWTLHQDGTAVDAFFAALSAGTVTPKVIWIPDEWSRAGNVETSLSNNAEAIANFVNAGGGLFANNGSYGWLSTLLPNAQFVPGGCNGGPALSTDGQNAFPTLTNQMVEACWHGSFWGSYPGLVSLVEWPYDALNTGATPTPMAPVAIGGANVTMPTSFKLETNPPQAIPSDTVDVIASAIGLDGTIYSGVTVSFSIASGPHAGWTATATTGADGLAHASLTYLADGTDVIEASATVNGSPKTQTYSLDWAPAFTPTRYVDAVLGVMTAGVPYSNGIAADGRPAPTYAISNGSLPAGLSMNASTGAITGTPTTPGSFSFEVTATNGAGSATKTFAGSVGAPTVSAPSWSDTTLAAMSQDAAYSDGVLASGYPAATYAVTNGSLPAGLSLDASTGAITGTPTEMGAYSFEITASNSEGSVSYSFSGSVGAPAPYAPTWTDSSIGSFVKDAAFSDAVSADSYPAATYSVTAGALPDGISLDAATGAITGTPTTAGAYSFEITASNSEGSVAYSFSGTVTAAPSWSDASLAAFTQNVAYSDAVTATATPDATYSVTAGALPDGISLDAATGAITGTPTTAGAYSFEITASNSEGSVAYSFSGTVYTVPAWSDSTLSGFSKAVAYSDAVEASGIPAPTYAITDGALPDGISLDAATGAITGTPTTAGAYSFEITASSAAGSVSHTFSGAVSDPTPVWSDSSIGNFSLAVPFANGVEASSSAGVTYAITDGALPDGLSLDPATGAITGTPTTAGAYSFEITATATGTSPALTSSLLFTGTVQDTTPVWYDSDLGDITAGVPYLDGVFGTSSIDVTYAITNGSLPAGLSLDPATGAITGTVTTPGAYSFEITATSDGGTVTLSFSGSVLPNPPVFDDAVVGAGTHGVAYADGVSASSFAPVTYSVTAGALPAGLSLDAATGAITGTPTAAGSYSFEITATSDGGSTSVTLSIEVAANPPVFPQPSLGNATQGSPYSASTGASSFAPVTYSVTAGALPAGLSLDAATGAITGTPTAAGSYSFEITATSDGGSTSVSVTITVVADPPVVGDSTLANGVAFVPYSDGVSGSSTHPIAYAITAGALPSGLTLNASTGAITGTPSSPGTYTFEVTVSSIGGSVSFTRTVVIATLAFEPQKDVVNTGSDTGSLDFSTAPAGATLDVSAPKDTDAKVAGVATISGSTVVYTPNTGFSGLAKVTVTVSINGYTEQREYTFTVNPAPAGSSQYSTAPVSGSNAWLASPRASGGTTISWSASPNAIGYEVVEIPSVTAMKVRAKSSVLCSTTATSCTIPAIAGPNTKYQVVALGRDNLRSEVITAGYKKSSSKRGTKALRANFAMDSSRLSALAKRELRALAAQIKKAGFTSVVLVGHTDELGTVWYNNGLGLRRANAVKAYLAPLVGSGVKITTISKGSREPLAAGKTSAARELNRRTEVYLG